MKRFTGLSIVAVLAMALAAMPVCAQSRGGGSSRSGGGASHYGGGGGGRSSSSMSSPSRGGGSYGGSMSRSSGGSYGGSSMSRSSGSSSRSSTYSYGSQSRGSYSTPQRQTQSGGQVRRSTGQPQTGGAVRSGSGSSSTRVVPQSDRSRASQTPRTQSATPRTQSATPRTQSSTPRVQGVQPQRQGTQARTQTGRPVPAGEVRPAGGQPQRVQMHNNASRERIEPRYRDPMPYNRPSRFWDHGHHYFGYRVHYLPSRYHIHRYWGRDYYIIDGLYYRHYLDWYYVCRPPFGVYFDPVLDIAYAACTFAYYNSVYNTFSTINENANTITAQNEIIAQNNATIAQQNETIALNSERALAAQKAADEAGLVQSYADAGTEYFYDDGVFFTKDKDGKYVTIVPPAGALVKELPDDYETITLGDKEYYKVDDTVFRTTVVEGTVYFEVLGQMTGDLAAQFDSFK